MDNARVHAHPEEVVPKRLLRGRKPGVTKRTPEIDQRIRTALELGASYCAASAYAGIAYITFVRWRDMDDDFAAMIELAQGKAQVGWLAKIEKAATDGNWQAAAWKLERRYPDEYGRRDRLDININREAQRVANELGISVEDVLAEAQRIAEGSDR